MKKIAVAATTVALAASSAQAGGLDRTRLGFGVLFEKGNYVEFGATHVAPKVSGTYTGLPGPAAAFNGSSTGDMAGDYTSLSFAYKRDVTDDLAEVAIDRCHAQPKRWIFARLKAEGLKLIPVRVIGGDIRPAVIPTALADDSRGIPLRHSL